MFEDMTRFEQWIPREAPRDLEDLDPRLRIHGDDSLEVWYAPLAPPAPSPDVWIIGLTPGWQQARIAYEAAADALNDGASPSEAVRRPKPQVAFAGSMRTNLVSMLDEIGLPGLLGVSSTADLFASERLRTGSALRYPVFRKGRNYSGHGPKPTRHPVLLEMLDVTLAAELASATDCLIVPLGKAVEACLQHSAARGRLDPERVLFGFPHPSGANGHRHSQFARERAALVRTLQEWGGATA